MRSLPSPEGHPSQSAPTLSPSLESHPCQSTLRFLSRAPRAASAEWAERSLRSFASAACPSVRWSEREDERAEALRAIGAEVVVGDLTRAGDVARALAGCRRMYFGMSVSAPYLEATVTAAAVARERGDLEVFVNISQMTVSQMSLTEMTDSPQQRQHWLGEQVLNWSGLARGPRPGHGLPPAPLLLGLGRRIDRPGRHDPAAVRRRANVAHRRPGCGGGYCDHPGQSDRLTSARSTN